jgi:hypothetical protein
VNAQVSTLVQNELEACNASGSQLSEYFSTLTKIIRYELKIIRKKIFTGGKEKYWQRKCSKILKTIQGTDHESKS